MRVIVHVINDTRGNIFGFKYFIDTIRKKKYVIYVKFVYLLGIESNCACNKTQEICMSPQDRLNLLVTYII